MSKPVGKSQTVPPNLNSLKVSEPDKKVVNAFEVLMSSSKPKKSTTCTLDGCSTLVSLAFKDSTCVKCHKAFCKVHVAAEVHACMEGFNKI